MTMNPGRRVGVNEEGAIAEVVPGSQQGVAPAGDLAERERGM